MDSRLPIITTVGNFGTTGGRRSALCEWIFQPNPAASMFTVSLTVLLLILNIDQYCFDVQKLNLESINLQGDDIVKVYAGNSASAPLARVYSNASIASLHPIYVSSGSLFVQFTAGSTSTGSGFSARFWIGMFIINILFLFIKLTTL